MKRIWPLGFLSLMSIYGFIGLFNQNYSQAIWIVWIIWLLYFFNPKWVKNN
jgi:hypothetical protein